MDGWFKCRAAEAVVVDKLVPTGENKWDKINLGKCRHGILCAYIQSGRRLSEIVDFPKTQEAINKLAHFSMTGEVK
jgi:hypothetical protein